MSSKKKITRSSKTKKIPKNNNSLKFPFSNTNTGLIDQVKLGKQLGKGMMGTTFLAKRWK